jgi:hypothetical protein
MGRGANRNHAAATQPRPTQPGGKDAAAEFGDLSNRIEDLLHSHSAAISRELDTGYEHLGWELHEDLGRQDYRSARASVRRALRKISVLRGHLQAHEHELAKVEEGLTIDLDMFDADAGIAA